MPPPSTLLAKTDIANALNRAHIHSPFLRRAIDNLPDICAFLRSGDIDGAITASHNLGADDDMDAALRKKRTALSLSLAIADLSVQMSFADVTRHLSDFADRAIQLALEDIFRRRYDCEPKGFAVIALGKLGGRELNYSSDIDPIFLFDPDNIPTRGRETPVDAAQRISRKLIAMLNERTEHGYVFRVDMRLRPAAEVSPLALPINTAISHYESQALTWEQAAFIRARFSGGDKGLGDYFLTEIQPFIWRRSLDFGTIDAIADLTRRIREHYTAGQIFGAGYDLKRGRGGIREVEFFVQSQQLVHGGRNPRLRHGTTLPALNALAAEGVLQKDTADMMAQNYIALRSAEHRLQMVDDRQTHSLPKHIDGLNNVARLAGWQDGQGMLQYLQPVVESVGLHYDGLMQNYGLTPAANQHFGESGGALDPPDILADEREHLVRQLAVMGYSDAESLARMIGRWRRGGVRALRNPASLQAFEKTIGVLLENIARNGGDMASISRLDSLLHKLPSVLNLFHLLEARPSLSHNLAAVLTHAPALANALSQRADLLDALVDSRALAQLKGREQLVADLRRGYGDNTIEALLDHVRLMVAEQRFVLGVKLIEQRRDPLLVARDYSWLAEAAIQVIADAVTADFASKYGHVDGGELMILGLGRLGGEALTHASDLDLVFLFTGSHDTRSSGDKAIGATQYFNRLAQRIVAALSVPTAHGALYDVDTRLRPSGAQGLLAVSVDSFWKYQKENAWTWEHMALCRARAVYGSSAAREIVSQHIAGILKDIESSNIAQRALAMRSDIATSKPPTGYWDAKLVDGGLVDLEFAVHVQQLIHKKGLSSQLPDAIDDLISSKLLPPEFAQAHDFLTRLLIVLRLVEDHDKLEQATTRELVAQICGADNWDGLKAHYDYVRAIVRKTRQDVVGTIAAFDTSV